MQQSVLGQMGQQFAEAVSCVSVSATGWGVSGEEFQTPELIADKIGAI